MKRIAIDAHVLGNKSGGNESYYINLINNLEYDEKKIEIILLLKKEYDISKIKIKFTPIYFKSTSSFIRNFIEIPYLVKKNKIDLLHMQYFIPFIRFCPTVVSIHDISYEHYKGIFTKRETCIQKLLIPYAAKHSKVIFTSSNYSKNDIVNQYKINQHKIIVTFNGVSSAFRKIEKTNSLEELLLIKFNITPPYILCVGNLQPRKNIKRLLKAYAKFQQEVNSDLKLVIVGKKAWMYNDIFEETQNNKLQNDVIFTNYVTEKELIALYNYALFFIYPSIFEGFGLPVLEAMACGTAVAASNVTSIPEVIGDAGIQFDPFNIDDIKEAIKKLYFDQELRESYKRKGIKQATKFSWRKMSQIIYETYKNVLGIF